MPKFFVKNNQIENNQISILGEDVKHLKNALRVEIGENIQICNTDTLENFEAQIKEISKELITCEIISKINSTAEPKTYITIFQGLPKADKMELIIEKSVEIGVSEIIPIEMKRSVVKFDEATKVKKVLRWQKISEVAAKQSGRDIIPKIDKILSFEKLENEIDKYDMFLVAYENEDKNTLKNELKQLKKLKENVHIGVLIGPEGGISEEEISILKHKDAKVITLGKRILRTETVALAISSMILYELEEFDG